MLPSWTETEDVQVEAVQHLRLDDVRELIGQVLFNYVTTVTPFVRNITWLCFIYSLLRRNVMNDPTSIAARYRELLSRYYSIMATADTIHSMEAANEHLGPTGRDGLSEALKRTIEAGRQIIDFTQPDYAYPTNPNDTYRSSMANMGLGTNIKYRFKKGTIAVFPLTPLGDELAESLREIIENAGFSVEDFNNVIWNLSDLRRLSEAICLHKLVDCNREIELLIHGCQNALIRQDLFDDFKRHVLYVGQIYSDHDLAFKSENTTELALFHRTFEIVGPISTSDDDSVAILALSELHTYFSFYADGLLSSLLRESEREGAWGIQLGTLIQKSVDALGGMELELFLAKDTIRHLEELVLSHSIDTNQARLKLCPEFKGELGLFTLSQKIKKCYEAGEYPTAIALASIGMLVTGIIQARFDQEWLESVVSGLDYLFGAKNADELFQKLGRDETLSDWVRDSIMMIIQQHEEVANSKGDYSRRFFMSNDNLVFRKEAGFSFNRGRLESAISWMADLGLLERSDAMFRIRKVE